MVQKLQLNGQIRLDTHPGLPNFPLCSPEHLFACHEPRVISNFILQENVMKRLALVAAVLAVSACAKAENKPDTTTPAMAPAPAPAATTDTGMKMSDSAHKADSLKADSVKKDSAAKATKKP